MRSPRPGSGSWAECEAPGPAAPPGVGRHADTSTTHAGRGSMPPACRRGRVDTRRTRDRRQPPGDRASRQLRSPSLILTTLRSPRWSATKSKMSAATTFTGSLSITAKNVFRSWATARNVFGRHRPATKARYESTSGSPSAKRASPTRGRSSDQTRELVHPHMLQPPSEGPGDAAWIIRVLGDRGRSGQAGTSWIVGVRLEPIPSGRSVRALIECDRRCVRSCKESAGE